MRKPNRGKFWKDYWHSLPELSIRAQSVISNWEWQNRGCPNFYDDFDVVVSKFRTGRQMAANTRDIVIEGVKSKTLMKRRNCGYKTFNEIAKAFGLEQYCITKSGFEHYMKWVGRGRVPK